MVKSSGMIDGTPELSLAPVHADGGEVEDRCSTAHDVKGDPGVA